MYRYIILLGVVVTAQASLYNMAHMKPDHFVSNMLLRDILERMGNELADRDTYLDNADSSAVVRDLSDKEIPIELPIDYDSIDAINPKTSIRDQEYLQHSTLWGHQQLGNYNDRHRIKPGAPNKPVKDDKAENQLPAYCTPPNPCPVGYTSENDCIEDFENTAAFSRDYQSAQDCMCDSEHMMDCVNDSNTENEVIPRMPINNVDFDQIVERFQEDNPFFRGEKLPIAAKKGINVGF